MIGAETAFAFAAICHRVGKSIFMAGIFQYLAIGQNGGIESFNIVALINHRAPPGLLKVIFQFNTERTEIIDTLHAAVDIGILKYKTSPFAERDKLIH